MATVIAICTDAAVFQGNKILNKNIAKEFPGALWVTKFAEIAQKNEIKVLTGDLAIAEIQEESLKPSDILVIEEESTESGKKLVQLGAKPFLLTCFESPLYTRRFYANLPKISSLFKNRILFRGVFTFTSKVGDNHVLYFPSFSLYEKNRTVPWSDRGLLVMVAANKYWNPGITKYQSLVYKLKNLLKGSRSYITAETRALQLHDRRLDLVEYFGQKKRMDLFGSSWGDLSNLPKAWRCRLKPVIDILNPSVCADKHSVIRLYKFAICFEKPGYAQKSFGKLMYPSQT